VTAHDDVERLRMLLAEAGYPDAHVWVNDRKAPPVPCVTTGVNGDPHNLIPADVVERAFRLIRAAERYGGPMRYMTSPTDSLYFD
jgi:hypothetical protein